MTLFSSDFHKKFQAVLIQQDLPSDRLADTLGALLARYSHFLFRVTVNPTQVAEAADLISPRQISIGTVVGYPLGNIHCEIKAVQLRAAGQAGADHVDIVLPIDHLLDGEQEKTAQEVKELTALSRQLGLSAAWVANLAFLNETQSAQAVAIIKNAGTPMVTNSGFNNQTALSDLATGSMLSVTACGGIDSAEQAVAFLSSGAERVASHKALDLLAGLETLLAYTE